MKEKSEKELIHRSRKKKSHLFRRTLSCLTSNVTIVCVVIGYIVGGGFLFKYMEGDAEYERLKAGSENVIRFKENFIRENRKQIQAFKNKLMEQTREYFNELKGTANLISDSTPSPPGGLRVSDAQRKVENQRKVEKLLSLVKNLSFVHVESYTSRALRSFNNKNSEVTDNFIEQIYNTTITGYVIDFNENNTTLWTLPGSLLYSVTVITTIGYGNIVPKTMGGKLSTIFYAMFGIPLMLICLANLGSFFAELFTLLYNCIIKRCKCTKSTLRPRSRSFSPSHPIIKLSEPSRSSSLPNKQVTGKKLAPLSKKGTNLTELSNPKNQGKPNKKNENNSESIELWEISENYQIVPNDQNNLPLTFVLFLFIIYILIGSVFISNSENWDYLNSVYFVFITFSTIGFGDLVPGSQNYQWSNDFTPILCALYLLMGLVLVSVCFQLIQDLIRRRARKMGQHIGLLHSHSVY